MAKDAGLAVERISFANDVITIWNAILLEAEKCGKVAALLTLAQEEYPENPKVLTAINNYQTGQPSGGTEQALSSGHAPAPSIAATDAPVTWLWPLLDAHERARLTACFTAFNATPLDKAQLITTAWAVEELEKEYIPQNSNHLTDPTLQGGVLVCTRRLRKKCGPIRNWTRYNLTVIRAPVTVRRLRTSTG